MQSQPEMRMRRRAMPLLLISGLAVFSLSVVRTFVAPPSLPSNMRSISTVSRRAEGEEDGGFMKFLKVEQDIQLSPEEYQVALDAEVEAERKKYYIGGEVKPNNLVVPWKPVDEKQLIKDAKKTLKKNGIRDPSGEVDEEEADSQINLACVGGQDVRIKWTGGVPGQKVGYLVEKKRVTDANFQEIASYENVQNTYLLAKDYPGHDYTFTDDIVTPGSYTYRILYRMRSGEVVVVDQQDITIRELEGLGFGASGAIFLVVVALLFIVSYFADPPIS